MFVKINGETHYLWRAVDHEGEILESYVTKTRDKKAAMRGGLVPVLRRSPERLEIATRDRYQTVSNVQRSYRYSAR